MKNKIYGIHNNVFYNKSLVIIAKNLKIEKWQLVFERTGFRPYPLMRQIFLVIMRDFLSFNLIKSIEITDYIGVDHSYLCYSKKQINNFLFTDKDFKIVFEKCKEEIKTLLEK